MKQSYHIISNFFEQNQKTANKILSFKRLPQGWHYGAGDALSESSINNAVAWSYRLLHDYGFADTDAFPGTDDEVLVTGYYQNHYIELLIENDDKISVVYEIDKEQILSLEHVGESEACEVIEKIANRIWNTYALSIPYIMTTAGKSSKALRSETLQMVGLPSSTQNVFSRQTTPHAGISKNITPAVSPEILLSFGNSTNQYFPLTR